MQPTNLPELESIITTLVADAKCACHIINPHKTRILMWKETKDGQTTYHLKIGIQKFISQPQKDRNGETYWRYWVYKEEENLSNKEVKKEAAELETHESTDTQPTNEQSSQHR